MIVNCDGKEGGIWGTIEVNCWSRRLNYLDYIKYHRLSNQESSPLNSVGYACLCVAMESNMRYEMEKETI